MTVSENVVGDERVRISAAAGHAFEQLGDDAVAGRNERNDDHEEGAMRTLASARYVRDRLVTCAEATKLPPGVGWSRKAASFFQGNRFLIGALLGHVLARADGVRVLDLYAGVGLFAVALAARGAAVTAVEGDAAGGADLSTNAAPWVTRLTVRPLRQLSP